MTDGEALLKAIHAFPREDTPRLIYADWLDENAEMQTCPTCKARKGFNRCWKCDGSGRIPDYKAAWAAFIRDCPPLLYERVGYGRWEWRYDKFGNGKFMICGMPQQFRAEAMLAVSAGGMRRWSACTIRKGFVDTVTMYPDDWLHARHGYRIRSSFPLTGVTFTAAVPFISFPHSPHSSPRTEEFKARLPDRLEFHWVSRVGNVFNFSYGRPPKIPGLELCRIEWPGIEFSYADGVAL